MTRRMRFKINTIKFKSKILTYSITSFLFICLDEFFNDFSYNMNKEIIWDGRISD